MDKLAITILLLLTIIIEIESQNVVRDTSNIFINSILLNGVDITAEKNNKHITGSMSDMVKLDIKNMQNMPQFMGTVDLLRTLQLMPGVQTSGEMNSGIYIRGGDSSHNKFLINDATLYNPSHMLGFFSIFNSSHVSNAFMMKSFIPAEYGGQLSSVISVDCEAEEQEKIKLDGNIGIIASQLTMSVPIGKKNSLKVSGRKTYIGALMELVVNDKSRFKPKYDFEDYNLTYTGRFNSKNKITINGYIGNDKLYMNEYYYQTTGESNWRNYAISAKWTYKVNDKLDVKNTIYASHYDNKVGIAFGSGKMIMDSKINDLGYKGKIKFSMKRLRLDGGVDFICHNILPQYPGVNTILGVNQENVRPGIMKMYEISAYAQAIIKITDKINTSFGLRYSSAIYNNEGKGMYKGFEPKLKFEYLPNGNTRYYFSFATQKQYINQVMVSGIGMPTDFWLPVTKDIPPQTSYNLSLGFYKSLLGNSLEINADLYYRRFNNQIEFNGELFSILNDTYKIEEHLIYGIGWSYGMEIMLKYNYRNFNGWVSYTLGKSDRKFPEINNGEIFPAKNDRRHDLSVAGSYQLNKRWNLSGVFVLASGNAFTMPVAVYIIGDNMVNEYGPYNGSRMPLYHRMDLSATYNLKKRKNRKVDSSFNFSLYNCYGRNNPAFVHVKAHINESKDVSLKLVGASIYNVIPSISYRFKF